GGREGRKERNTPNNTSRGAFYPSRSEPLGADAMAKVLPAEGDAPHNAPKRAQPQKDAKPGLVGRLTQLTRSSKDSSFDLRGQMAFMHGDEEQTPAVTPIAGTGGEQAEDAELVVPVSPQKKRSSREWIAGSEFGRRTSQFLSTFVPPVRRSILPWISKPLAVGVGKGTSHASVHTMKERKERKLHQQQSRKLLHQQSGVQPVKMRMATVNHIQVHGNSVNVVIANGTPKIPPHELFDVMEKIRSFSIMRQIKPQERTLLASQMRKMLIEPESYILQEGEHGEAALFLITSGKITISVASPVSDGIQVATDVTDVKAPTYVGEGQCLTGSVPMASVRVKELVTAYAVLKTDFDNLISASSRAALIREMEKRTFQKEHLDDLWAIMKSAPEGIACMDKFTENKPELNAYVQAYKDISKFKGYSGDTAHAKRMKAGPGIFQKYFDSGLITLSNDEHGKLHRLMKRVEYSRSRGEAAPLAAHAATDDATGAGMQAAAAAAEEKEGGDAALQHEATAGEAASSTGETGDAAGSKPHDGGHTGDEGEPTEPPQPSARAEAAPSAAPSETLLEDEALDCPRRLTDSHQRRVKVEELAVAFDNVIESAINATIQNLIIPSFLQDKLFDRYLAFRFPVLRNKGQTIEDLATEPIKKAEKVTRRRTVGVCSRPEASIPTKPMAAAVVATSAAAKGGKLKASEEDEDSEGYDNFDAGAENPFDEIDVDDEDAWMDDRARMSTDVVIGADMREQWNS
ncbi:unnamed protein product, partial [Chrysoparadoxa australica]